MNPKVKKFMTVGLVIAGVGIWVPQLLMGVVQKAPRERLEVSNEGEGFGAVALEGDVAVEGNARNEGDPLQLQPHGDGSGGAGMSQGGELSLPQALSQATQRIELRDSRAERVGLSELLGAFRPGELDQEPELVTGRSEQSAAAEPLADRRLRSRAIAADRLAEYCEEFVLSAIILGDNGSIAMISGSLVHEGDVLGRGIQVTQIERRSVTLSYRGVTQAIGLQVFESRSSTGGSQSVEGDESIAAPSSDDESLIESGPSSSSSTSNESETENE